MDIVLLYACSAKNQIKPYNVKYKHYSMFYFSLRVMPELSLSRKLSAFTRDNTLTIQGDSATKVAEDMKKR